ncbi:hypothetical protein K488DRAFT_83353 [Vararia minispora EC-137]|uniref:Uncharacterized protein n=1 Tax=Vararia minispora EC-137 TaxID=1314806 RepID=A0ACB8QTY5_9AGAM|nr:hypothetical protein K488DRAFT_83353 [Vararia minispora EC-137]
MSPKSSIPRTAPSHTARATQKSFLPPGTFSGRGIVWKKPWYRTWEDIEEGFKKAYDPKEHISDRIYEAAQDFQEWPRPPSENRPGEEDSLNHLWDQFRIYIGLSYRPTVPSLARPEDLHPQEDDDSDCEEGATASLGALPVRQRTRARFRVPTSYRVFRGIGAPYDDHDDQAAEQGMTTREQYVRHIEERDDNMDRFIQNPEQAMKHLFSAYFWAYQLVTAKKALLNMPVLALFFLRHLRRSGAFDAEDVPRLEAAISVVERAQFELRQMVFVASRFPDEFSKRCHLHWAFHTHSVDGTSSSPFAHDITRLQNAIVGHLDHWGAFQDDPADHVIPHGDESKWIHPLLHPSLDHTHELGVAESSVRRIVDVRPPTGEFSHEPGRSEAEEIEAELTCDLYAVTLAPVPGWRSWKGQWDEVEPPTFDGSRDTRGEIITLLVDSESVEARVKLPGQQQTESVGRALSQCCGMMIAARWVELVPKKADGPGRFWFMDQYIGMLPSYYTPDKPQL